MTSSVTVYHLQCTLFSLLYCSFTLSDSPLGVVNKRGYTPLGVAVVVNELNLVKYLITEHSVDVNGGL